MSRRIRAGRLSCKLTISEMVEAADEFGRVTLEPNVIATPLAEVLQASTGEFLREPGKVNEAAIVFFIRWNADIRPGQTIEAGELSYVLKEVKEIGRRQGMELRCIGKVSP